MGVGDATLRTQLADPVGAYKFPDIQMSRWRDDGDVRGWGAQSGNIATALASAVEGAEGSIIIPAGEHTASPTIAQVPALLELLSRADFRGKLVINLPAGTINLTKQTSIKGQRIDLCQVNGVAVNTTVTGISGVTGAAKNYSVTLMLADASQVSAGDYLIVRHDITGTGYFHIHCGGWRVTAVNGNSVTVLNTCMMPAFPASTITGGTVAIIKTVLKYTGCDGIRPEGGGCIAEINGVAIVGDYVLSTGTGTIGAHGVIGATPEVVVDPANTSNNVANMDSAVALGPDVVISGWGEQGLAVSGRASVVCNFIAVCSNRKRGVYAEGAHIRGKFMLCSGNGEDGIISDTTGFVQAAYAVCSGNGLNGFWSTNLSLIAAARAVACCNGTNGFEARGQTRMAVDLGLSYGNTLDGVNASDGGMVDFDSGVARNNTRDGIVGTYNAMIDANDASSQSNGRYGVSNTGATINLSGGGIIGSNTSADYRDGGANSVTVRPNGNITPANSIPYSLLQIRNATSEAGANITATTNGDVAMAQKNSEAGSLNTLFVWRADGTFHPKNDGTQNIGRSANRWNVGFFAGGTQSSSDSRLKDPTREFSQAELNVAMKLAEKLGFWTWLDDEVKRLHAGTTVQAALAVLEEEGLDWTQYGFIGYDSWEDEYESVMVDDGYGALVESGEMRLVRAAGDLWQFRDQELDRFIMRGLAERLSKLEAKIQ